MKPKFYALRFKNNQNSNNSDQLTSSSSSSSVASNFNNYKYNYFMNNNIIANSTMINYNNTVISQLKSDSSNCNFMIFPLFFHSAQSFFFVERINIFRILIFLQFRFEFRLQTNAEYSIITTFYYVHRNKKNFQGFKKQQ
jgi:hypothetical protein